MHSDAKEVSPSGNASGGLAAAGRASAPFGSPCRRLLSPLETREAGLDWTLMRLWPRRDLTVQEVAAELGEGVKLARRRAQRLGLGRKPYATERAKPDARSAKSDALSGYGLCRLDPPEHVRRALYRGRSYAANGAAPLPDSGG